MGNIPKHLWFLAILSVLLLTSTIFAEALAIQKIDYQGKLIEKKAIAEKIVQEESMTRSSIVGADAVFDLPSMDYIPLGNSEMPLVADANSIGVVPDRNTDYSKINFNEDKLGVREGFYEKKLPPQRLDLNDANSLEMVSVQDAGDMGSTNTCTSSSTTDLWANWYYEYLDYSADIDWYKGYRAGTNSLRFILVPPIGKDYDLKIYDSCANLVKTCDGATSGQIESCTATVTDDFYVKVYGYNDVYSTTAPYTLAARGSGSCNITMNTGASSKNEYLCNDSIRVDNTKINNNNPIIMLYPTIAYLFFEELYTPNKNLYQRLRAQNFTYVPYSSTVTQTGGTFIPPTQGGWPDSGNYTERGFILGWCGNNYDNIQTVETTTNPRVSCTAGSITGYNGSPEKNSFSCSEDIVTSGHIFENTSNTYPFNYSLYAQLKDPDGTVIDSTTTPNQTLNAINSDSWKITFPAPIGGWAKKGTYTVKAWVDGTFSDGRRAMAESYAYPYVPDAPCKKACEVQSNSAWVEQDGKCNEQIIAKHQFDNTGTRTFPHNANFYLYDQSNNRIKATSNSYSIDPNRSLIWAVKWNVPQGGWKPGTYRSEAYTDGTCTGGGTSSASNSVTASIPQSCGDTACSGMINVSVNDGASNPVPDAKAYIDSSYHSSTNASGNASIPVSDSACGRSHSIGIYCSDGTYCDTKSTSISTNGDSKSLPFSCGVCAKTQNLTVSATTNKESYRLNETIRLETTVRAQGNNIDASNLSINDPFTGQTIRTATSNGTNTYNSTASKTGVQTFTISASKSGYNSASASKSVAVSQELSTIYVSVANSDGTQMEGARLYLDSTYSGTTESSGKKTLSTTAGNHIVEATCPAIEYCGSTSGYFSGQKNISFKCNCDIDADGDGLSASEEEIIGSDPYNANSNLASALITHGAVNSCLNPVAGFIPFASESDRNIIVKNMGSMDYTQLSAAMSGKTILLNATVQSTNIAPNSIETKTITLKKLFGEYENTKAFAARDGTVVVIADNQSGATAITIVSPQCNGFFIGIFNGAYTGVKSDWEFLAGSPDMVHEGMKWAVKNWTQIILLATPPPFNIIFGGGKVVDFFANGTFINLFNVTGSEIRAATMETLKEGATWNKNQKGSDGYQAFQMGFLEGSVTGFLVEQTAIVAVTGGLIGYAKAIKLTGNAAKLVDLAYKAYSKIFGKWGGKIAELFKDSSILKWSSAEARDFAVQSTKWFPKAEDAKKFWLSFGEQAEPLALKSKSIYQKTASKIGVEEADKAFSKMFSSKYGKEGLETFEEGPLQQLAEVYQKHDSLIVERFGQNLENKGYSLKDAMTYADDVKDISGGKNLRANAVASNNLGDFFNLKRASELKKQANTVIREVDLDTESFTFTWEWNGKTLTAAPEKLNKDLVYDFSFDGKTKRILEEVKSKSGSRITITLGEEETKQLYKIAEGIRKGVADEARIVSPVGQIFENNYKKLAEKLGITVVEGVV